MTQSRQTILCLASPSGITLMEVLISLGILSVGLASVVALVPAGGSQARLAMIDDVALNVGNSAHADLVNRGFLNPTSWTPMQSGTYSIAIDPLGAAAFPSSIQKITLPGIANASPNAEAVFRWSDDLAFELPQAEELPPVPLYVPNTSQRLSEGNFSWFATLIPLVSGTTQSYRLSVVTCYKREPAPVISSPLPATSAAAGSDAVEVTYAFSAEDIRELFPRGTAVLLSATTTDPPVWRQVVMASPVEATGAITGVELMLDQPVPFVPTEVFFFQGAIGVAERVVALEEGSPWSE